MKLGTGEITIILLILIPLLIVGVILVQMYHSNVARLRATIYAQTYLDENLTIPINEIRWENENETRMFTVYVRNEGKIQIRLNLLGNANVTWDYLDEYLQPNQTIEVTLIHLGFHHVGLYPDFVQVSRIEAKEQ